MMSEKNRVPEGYKKTELGVIPQEWNVLKVNDFCDVRTGGTPSTQNKDFWDGDISWMSSGEINKKFVYDTEKKITQKGVENSNARILPEDSVMMALNGQGKTRGSVAVLKIPSTCNQSLACMIPNQKIAHYLYLFYNLQSRYSEIRNYTGDTGREGLNLKIIKDIKVFLPPFLEQQKIAFILSKVDEQIEQTEQIIEKTELLKKGLMQKLLIKGIWHTKFKKTELGEIPEEWKMISVNEIGDVKGGKRLPKGHPFTSEKTNYPYLRVVDFKSGTIDKINLKYISLEDYENIKQYTISSNDVYISIAGTIGLVGTIPKELDDSNLTENAAKIVITDKNKLDKYYLQLFLTSPIGQYQIESKTMKSAQPKLALSRIKEIEIPLPPLPEQQKIASIFSKVDSHILDNQNYLTKLQELKKGLMQDLLTGKVRVCV